jgi:hypothetical protein
MPFADEYLTVWEAVKEAVEGAGYRCLRADGIFEPGPVLSQIMDHIVRAEVVIADLTSRNANVYYELGITHTIKEGPRVVLLAQSSDEVPFDLRHLRFIEYRADDLPRLQTNLRRMLRQPALAEPSTEASVEIAEVSPHAPERAESPTVSQISISFSADEQLANWDYRERFLGGVHATLAQFFEFDDIQRSGRAVIFPDGGVDLADEGQTVPRLTTFGSALERTNELAAALGGGLREAREVTYWVQPQLSIKEVVQQVLQTKAKLTYLSSEEVTVQLGYQEVNLKTQKESGSAVTLRVPSWSPLKSIPSLDSVLAMLNPT